MSDDARLAKYRPLVFGIAPELNERPLYLHDVREFDGLPAHAGGCLGWAHNGANTDWPIADRLGSRWEGPGPVIAIDFEAVQVAARSSETFENCVASVLIHEVAHVLPPPPPMADLPPTPERKAFQLEVMAPGNKSPGSRAWQRSRFTRVIVHSPRATSLRSRRISRPCHPDRRFVRPLKRVPHARRILFAVGLA